MSRPSRVDGASNLLKYHRPKQALRPGIKEHIPFITKESRQCLRNLASHKPRFLHHIMKKVPRERCAAVLVALFVGRKGDLYVLLSRRSSTLRSYAGDTSLPGGKVEATDRSFEDTARREAFEEIGLPPDKQKVLLLCTLDPFLAGNALVVVPIVVLVLDNTIRPILNDSEVTQLFSHPLASFLSETPPYSEAELSDMIPYHTTIDYPWEGPGPGPASHLAMPSASRLAMPPTSPAAPSTLSPDPFSDVDGPQETDPRKRKRRRTVRMHRFLTGREAGGIKPVFGLTAAILIHAASIGYGRAPDFEVNPPHAPSWRERIEWALLMHSGFQLARSKWRGEGARKRESKL
ncbi:NUDIX hydrolase domain-like protein [Schizophyllum amplum]|uniref:NUDIX hydrolase domain-like protein n=1 Tax=Schizophyllum amplum TaxID=97359 RepID=A0A550CSJ0_9AGAR|nr:NUDIX hydrolase domain-like protein [Auriculariopsis ampla]